MKMDKFDRDEVLRLCAKKYMKRISKDLPKPLLSPENAASLLGVSLGTLRKLPIVKVDIGSKTLYRTEDLEAYICKRKVKPE